MTDRHSQTPYRTRLESDKFRMTQIKSIMANLIPLSVCISLTLGGLSVNSQAQEEHGLRVGQKAPAFTLKDQKGKERSLSEWLKNGPVALVFYRSADW